MSFYFTDKYLIKDYSSNLNEELLKLDGHLTDEQAKITLAKFLRRNIGFMAELMLGFDCYPYQEILLKAFFLRNFALMIASRGASKTVWYNRETLLVDEEKGLSPINELFPNIDFSKGDRWENVKEVNLWNGSGWKKVNKIYIQPSKKCIKITTRRQYTLTGSINHLIKIIDLDCNIIWKRFSELKNGDYICIDRSIVKSEDEKVSKQDKDESYLIGLLIGDGCMSLKRKHFSLTTNDKQILDFALKFTKLKVQKKQGTTTVDIRFTVNFCQYLLNKYKLKQGLSYDKEIPTEILKSKEKLRECLRGIFDTDGTVNWQHEVSVTSTSKFLIDQIHLCLLNFGMVSTIRERRTPSPFGRAWKLTISGNDLRIFVKEIGFKLTRKHDKIKNIEKKGRNTNLDVVPYAIQLANSIKEKTKISWTHPPQKGKPNLSYRQHNSMNTSYEVLTAYIDFFREKDVIDSRIKILENLEEHHYFFDKIVSLEDLTADCIDLNVPDGEQYWANGFINHNSTIAAVAASLIPIVEPNITIACLGPVFRAARNIFNEMQKFHDSSEGLLFRQCIMKVEKRPEMYQVIFHNGSRVIFCPLNGQYARGIRAQVLILDEFLLLTETVVNEVLMPFLIVPADLKRIKKIRAKEDKLIEEGKLKQEDRTKFKNSSRLIALSSASYSFEYLAKLYEEWVSNILSKAPMEDASYFVCNIGYQMLPPDMVEKSVVEQAKAGGEESGYFQREYCARFVDGGEGYYSAKRMIEQTVPDGESPIIQLKSNPGDTIVISIDPSFSQAPNSDNFAMSVGKISENGGFTVIHNYAKAGEELGNHIKYFHYLLIAFNPDLIICDNSDGNFLQSCNESSLFEKSGINLDFIDYDGGLIGIDRDRMLKEVKKQYSKSSRKICFKHIFTSQSIRRLHEQTQTMLNSRKIWWASRLEPNELAFNKAVNINIPYQFEGKENIVDFISTQDDLIYLQKKETALIEIRASPIGNLVFDLPANLKRDESPNRARRDLNTSLILLTEGVRAYNEIMQIQQVIKTEVFKPCLVGHTTRY